MKFNFKIILNSINLNLKQIKVKMLPLSVMQQLTVDSACCRRVSIEAPFS